MTHEYALSRVRDALEKSDGNASKAQRLVLSWVEKDHTLLFGLIAPHLQSIVTHAVAHAAKRTKKPSAKKIIVNPEETGEFGAAVLGSLRGTRQSLTSPEEPSKASRTHVDAIHKLAAAAKNKDKKDKK